MKKVTLVSYITSQTALSRRKVLDLLKKGEVLVNGKVAMQITMMICSNKDQVTVSGDLVYSSGELLYYKFNKPSGVITTLSDPKNRTCLKPYIEKVSLSLFPVGRLDRKTTGLLILTNDGDFSYQLTHPKYEISKTYMVGLDKPIVLAGIQQLLAGLILEDGPVRFDKVDKLDNKRLKVTLFQGRNRLVRRAFTFLGYEVVSLKRVAIGQLSLGALRPGEMKKLIKSEQESLLKGGAFDGK